MGVASIATSFLLRQRQKSTERLVNKSFELNTTMLDYMSANTETHSLILTRFEGIEERIENLEHDELCEAYEQQGYGTNENTLER